MFRFINKLIDSINNQNFVNDVISDYTNKINKKFKFISKEFYKNINNSVFFIFYYKFCFFLVLWKKFQDKAHFYRDYAWEMFEWSFMHRTFTKVLKKVQKNKKIIHKKYKNSFLKKFNFFNVNFFKVNFLRNNTIYIKSKFSKARAFCKNIVIFSLLLNIIVINELHSIYYSISINYGYLYTIIYISFVLYCFSLIIKKN